MCSHREKYQNLLRELKYFRRAVIAFSGGLDSTFLVHASRQVLKHSDILAITCITTYMPESEIEESRCTAAALKVLYRQVTVPFSEELRTNPPNRCHLCKRILFSQLVEVATSEQFPHILDGTNRDDLNDYRPGRQVLEEFGVKSPLLMADLTKQDIRALAREHGLAWDKPAGTCLLTRVPHGTLIKPEELRRIERIEAVLHDLGFGTVRLRSHGDLARIEVPQEQLVALIAAERRHGIDAKLREMGYRHVTVDLAGYRRGSLSDLPNETRKD